MVDAIIDEVDLSCSLTPSCCKWGLPRPISLAMLESQNDGGGWPRLFRSGPTRHWSQETPAISGAGLTGKIRCVDQCSTDSMQSS